MSKSSLYLVLLVSFAGGIVLLPAPAQKPPEIGLPDDKPAKKEVTHAKGYKPLPADRLARLHAIARARHGNRMARVVAASTPPAEFDVADMGWAVPPGDQASCGSCYLYSTVKTMSGAAVKAGVGKASEFKLSTQFGMDCHDFGGCNGGNGNEVVAWAVQNYWLAEADKSQDPSALYPAYTASSGRCKAPANSKHYTPKEWFYITSDQSDRPATVDEYKAALTTYGCVNVALDAGGQFGSYSGGVISSLGNNIDHEIQVRGYSDAKQALLLENQWAGWGGAKSPGDNCAWLSYKAVKALQDPFVVHWAELPPPPPPPPGGAPTVTSTGTVTAQVGASFSFQVVATNSPTSYGAIGLPTGLTIDAAKGTITGTPAAVGSYAVTVSATNASGTGTAPLMLTVSLTPPPAPVPSRASSVTITYGDGSTQTLYPLSNDTTLRDLLKMLQKPGDN